jgi:hypothetical protein
MSRFVSRFCIRQIVICCFVCSVSLVLFLNRPILNDYMLTVFSNLPQTELQDVQVHQQLERKNRLKEKCSTSMPAAEVDQSKQNTTTPVIFKVNDRHRVMYCGVPKVA